MPEMYRDIESTMLKANNNHFGFEGMRLTEPGQFTHYPAGGFYDWHQDASGQNSHGESRKLSLTFSLTDSDAYEGCNLEFFEGNKSMEDMKLSDGTIISAEQIKQDIRDQGSDIIFDSRDTHRVTTVSYTHLTMPNILIV